MKKAFSTI